MCSYLGSCFVEHQPLYVDIDTSYISIYVSIWLFSLYTESILREVEQDSRKDLYNEPNIQGLKLRDLRYADDTALLSTTTEGLHQLIHSVKEHSENKGLFLNNYEEN